jgi:hypothetical protein
MAAANAVAAKMGAGLLDVRAASLKRVVRREPLEPTWRSLACNTLTSLLPVEVGSLHGRSGVESSESPHGDSRSEK